MRGGFCFFFLYLAANKWTEWLQSIHANGHTLIWAMVLARIFIILQRKSGILYRYKRVLVFICVFPECLSEPSSSNSCYFRRRVDNICSPSKTLLQYHFTKFQLLLLYTPIIRSWTFRIWTATPDSTTHETIVVT